MVDYTVARIDALEGYYNGLFLKARDALGVTSLGLSIVDIPGGSVDHPEHSHPGGPEEALICTKGFGRLIMDEGAEFTDLEPGVMVRIGAETKRTIRVGNEGLQAIAIGGTPGEPYEAPAYTRIGAPDALQKRPSS